MSREKEEKQALSQPQVKIINQFIKDLSFENIAAQKGLISEALAPEIKVSVNLEAKKRPVENQYDVIIKTNISSETKSSKEMLFILEIYYGGIFQITNIPDDQLHPYLLIECPRILFPYLRRIISDISRDGGYPPINLDQIDFLSMYKAELNKRAPTNSKIN
ncbi:MAG: protein-export chaperone SecB [Paracoccaceae bacterium]